MPNPFPGINPYLEGPAWTTVHSNLVEEIARQRGRGAAARSGVEERLRAAGSA
jgi:hypothetical protein